MAKKPVKEGKFFNTGLAKTIRAAIDALSGQKSQREIAAEIGYEQPNIVSMLKSGETKVPLDRIPAISRTLGLDFSYALKLWFDQMMVDETDPKRLVKLEEIRQIFDFTPTVTEQKVLEVWREAAPEDMQSGFRPFPDWFKTELADLFKRL